MQPETDLTLANLARLYRDKADALDRDAGWADSQPERRSYHDGLANHCRFMAADWSALADLVDFAASRTRFVAAAEADLTAAAQRLAKRLEDIHG